MASNLSHQELQFDVQHAFIRVICDSSKIRDDTKEDTAIAAPNAGMAASMINIYQPTHSACKELPFDILHAYLESNRQVFQESGSSKKKSLKEPLPMLEWQVMTFFLPTTNFELSPTTLIDLSLIHI